MEKFFSCFIPFLFLFAMHSPAQTQGTPVSSSKSAVTAGSATVSPDSTGIKTSASKNEKTEGSAVPDVSTAEPVTPQSAEKKKPQ